MNRSFVLGVAWTLMVPAAAAAQSASTSSDSITRLADRAFDAFRGTDQPGCALGVSRNGRVVYERGYGMANLETGTPIRPASIFHVASISKQFTAMAVLLLASDGKLSIDDDVRKYIPELPDYGTPITLRHLMTHTSGLRDQWDLIQLSRGRFEENRITEADVMDIVPRQRALNFKPGSEIVYSNTGFTLLAVVVKRVSGQSLREFADARIFKPLGMTSTHFHDDYTMLVPGRTSAYVPVATGWRVSIPNFDTYGATSLFTTVGDLLKWEANYTTPVVGTAAVLDQAQSFARLANGDTATYGLGLAVARYRGAREIGHGGADAGYRSYVSRFPDHGLAIAIACNASTAVTAGLAHAVADAYLGSALAPKMNLTPTATSTPPASTLQARAGVYVDPTTRQVVEISYRDGALILGRTSGPTLIPVGDNRFWVSGQARELSFVDGPRAALESSVPVEARIEAGTAQMRRQPVRFEKQTAPPASGPQLAAFAGTYYSAELDATYRVTASDSGLVIRIGVNPPTPVRPIAGDIFLYGGTTVDFVRSGARITGFELTTTRTRRVAFVRSERPAR